MFQKKFEQTTTYIQNPSILLSLLHSLGLILFANAALIISAQITVPFWPVPFTMQNYALILMGLLMPWHLAVSSAILYIAEAAMGFGVLAGFSGGLAIVLGPTAGYIFGFAIFTGLIAAARQIFNTTTWWQNALVIVGAYIVFFAIAVSVLATFVGFETALKTGFYLFIVSEFLKIGLALSTVAAFKRLRSLN